MARGKPKDGSRHPNFKGGTSKTSHGYIIVFVGKDHHLADCRGYAYQHRLNAELKLGRKLKPGEVVHHDDENTQNNSFDNLIVKNNNAEHRHDHAKRETKVPGSKNPMIKCACGCGASFQKYDSVNRPRKFISGHNSRINGRNI